MIIIGYQGIGKTTLAGKHNFIDLESSNFWINGKRYEDWYIPYCNIAESLSKQGFNVFISSHEVVRKQLENSSEEIIIIYPSLELKEIWINKLKQRYEVTKTDKDFKAYINAKDIYEKNILDLKNSSDKFIKLEIKDINYDLFDMILYFVMQKYNH